MFAPENVISEETQIEFRPLTGVAGGLREHAGKPGLHVADERAVGLLPDQDGLSGDVILARFESPGQRAFDRHENPTDRIPAYVFGDALTVRRFVAFLWAVARIGDLFAAVRIAGRGAVAHWLLNTVHSPIPISLLVPSEPFHMHLKGCLAAVVVVFMLDNVTLLPVACSTCCAQVAHPYASS